MFLPTLPFAAPSSLPNASSSIASSSAPYYLTNPYKAKRPWPPDFSKLSLKHQLRIERKYERRSRMKLLRPGWIKGTKLAQLGLSVGVVIYGIFFLDWSEPPVKGKLSTKETTI